MQFFSNNDESLYLCFGELKIFLASRRGYRHRNLESLKIKEHLEFSFCGYF